VSNGRPKKPTALKVLEGNRGRRPLNNNEPQPDSVIPDCLDWLEPDAKEAYEQLAPMLNRLGLLTEADGHALAAYCSAFARWKRATEHIQKHGDTYPIRDNNGDIKYIQQFPEVSIANKAMTMMHKWGSAFGLSPSSRSNLAVNLSKPDVEDKWHGVFSQHG